jgi:hypothetical protein
MPFCPKCRAEYTEQIEACPECGKPLVESLPEQPGETSPSPDIETEYKEWVQLARLTSQQYAEMVVEALRAKNIPAVILSGTGHFGQLGMMNVSLYLPIGGGYSVMVPRKFAVDADREGSLLLGDVWEESRISDAV